MYLHTEHCLRDGDTAWVVLCGSKFGTCGSFPAVLLSERNGSPGLGPRALPPRQARRGFREEESQAVWPGLVDTTGCRNQARERLLHTYTSPPPPHRAPALTTLKFKVVGSQQYHPECWPFPKVPPPGGLSCNN